MTIRVLAFSGSLRKESLNQRLISHAASLAKAQGAEVTLVSLRDFDLPLFNEDIEKSPGTPPDVLRLKDLLKAHDAFLVACPEYNSSITPALKNAIDWASRPRQGEKPLECFSGKVVGLCATSPGALGGLRGLFHVRDIFMNIMARVVPAMVAVSGASMDEHGTPTDERQRGFMEGMVKDVVFKTTALRR
ncbi:MAG: NAD(P)H-dependent oxidoreductase [Phycisphaerales bacterium]|jgi:NAD(P)H-dependent FMN reductase|nr:NAD(P)H-dependent oxidoreductase [Phycisphaerales bacterium]